jgi:hypothetical protein
MDDRQLIADLLSALEYHTEQTRPIEFSRVAIEAAREYLRKPPQRTWVNATTWRGLTDEEIWKFWWSRPEVPEGEDDSMEAEFVAAVRRVLAAHGIKENT